MFKNYTFSKNPMHYVYAAVWLAAFVYLAVFLFSGKMFQPENGKIHIVAILFAWIVEYLGMVLTSVLIVLVGMGVALRTTLEKK
ncbi:hypothetical protein [Sphingobacterium paucimobilis]|uniref:Uncharacterized protein n=1 Tax=Sphingobacterium paucimobilis HER1398 TaxID=1346330 RepID=U2HS13_9SPHI|nr:hypothetical protein [Sphingobacterium paucimobilis]ERJ58035.1 hypothetical protein M472_04585 [Sphingobacterium paucimobilis HER1398]